MKKALIVIKEFSGREVGKIESIGEANDIDKRNGNLYENMKKINIPSSIENFPLKAIMPQAGETKAEFWFKKDSIVLTQPLVLAWQNNETNEVVSTDPIDEENFTEVNILDESYAYHPSEQEGVWNIIVDIVAYKTSEIQKVFNSMNVDVYNEMYNVFGTKNSESANAYNETYKLMQTSPSAFSNEGLLAPISTENFSRGDALDTDTKVVDFSTEALNMIDAYAVWRMKRIKQFSDEKAIIENA